ncbi:MAG: PorT family protein [Tannerellaceae bacterium]|jgi:hypothetical protein|nr:PorT family protein [Tannerellaceae bacterium]
MRKIFCLAILVAITSPAVAKIYLGARTGISRSSLVQKIDVDYWTGSCLGYSAALLADIPIYERFSFRPDIAVVYEGGSYRSGEQTGVFLLRHRLRNYSLQPSLNIAFNIPISGVKMAVYGGPALDFHLWSKVSTANISGAQAEVVEKEVKPIDIGVNTGISVEYKGVFFSISTVAGTLYRQKVKTDNSPSAYQNNLTFSLGYIFR